MAQIRCGGRAADARGQSCLPLAGGAQHHVQRVLEAAPESPSQRRPGRQWRLEDHPHSGATASHARGGSGNEAVALPDGGIRGHGPEDTPRAIGAHRQEVHPEREEQLLPQAHEPLRLLPPGLPAPVPDLRHRSSEAHQQCRGEGTRAEMRCGEHDLRDAELRRVLAARTGPARGRLPAAPGDAEPLLHRVSGRVEVPLAPRRSPVAQGVRKGILGRPALRDPAHTA